MAETPEMLIAKVMTRSETFRPGQEYLTKTKSLFFRGKKRIISLVLMITYQFSYKKPRKSPLFGAGFVCREELVSAFPVLVYIRLHCGTEPAEFTCDDAIMREAGGRRPPGGWLE
jgi:hypothetical protein